MPCKCLHSILLSKYICMVFKKPVICSLMGNERTGESSLGKYLFNPIKLNSSQRICGLSKARRMINESLSKLTSMEGSNPSEYILPASNLILRPSV